MKSIIFFLILIFYSLGVNAQNVKSKNRPLWGFSFVSNYPTFNLAKAGYSSGWGIGFEGYSRNLIYKKSKDWSLRFGESLNLLGQGHVKNNVLLHDPSNGPGTQNLSNGLYRFDLHTIILREKGSIRPYADIFAGGAVFESIETLTIDHPVPGYKSQSEYFYDRYTFEFGSSLGFLLKLSKTSFLNFKGSFYTYSHKIKFMDLKHLGFDGNMFVPNNPIVHPRMASFQVGMIFKFPYGNNRGAAHWSRRGHIYHGHYGGSYGGGCHGGGMSLH